MRNRGRALAIGLGLVLTLCATPAASASPARVVLNEVNANVAGGCDLVELLVLSGGSMDGLQLWERTSTVLTFSGLTVQAGDLVVVHVNSGSTTCDPGCANDTITKTDSTCPTSFATAFDWYASYPSLVDTTNVLTLYDASGSVIDGVLLADGLTGTVATVSETQAAVLAMDGQWQEIGGGVPAGGFVGADFRANAVLGLNATGTTQSGMSLQRTGTADTNTKGDWVTASSNWGASNPGEAISSPPVVPALGPRGGVALAIALGALGSGALRRRGQRARAWTRLPSAGGQA